MSNYKLSLKGIILLVVVPALTMFAGAGPASAQRNPANYTFLMATGFLCDTGDSSACPAVAKSAHGDSYEMSGAGTVSAESKSVTAVGTFTHKSASGVVLETGVWIANELVSFDSYGAAAGALTRDGRAASPTQFGSPQRGLLRFGPRGAGIFSAPVAAGGLAVMHVRLLPVLGFARNATLQVNCAIGKTPPERAVEGIRLAVEGGDAAFDEEVSGRTLFLLNRFAATSAAKTPAPGVDTEPAPTEVSNDLNMWETELRPTEMSQSGP